MPMQIEHEGQNLTVYTESEVQAKVDEEVKGLKITNENLKNEKKELQDKQAEAAEKARQAEEEKARRDGDYEKLERLLEERKSEESEKYQQLLSQIRKEKVNGALNDVVNRLGAGGAHNEDLRDLLRVRFEFDYDNEQGAVKVTGDGVNSLEELEQTIKNSERYAQYLAGSKATGGGAGGGKGTGAPSTGKKFNEMSGAELSALRRDDPQAYDRLRNEYYGN